MRCGQGVFLIAGRMASSVLTVGSRKHKSNSCPSLLCLVASQMQGFLEWLLDCLQVVESTGVVVMPYLEYPQLLGMLLRLLSEGDLMCRAEVLKVRQPLRASQALSTLLASVGCHGKHNLHCSSSSGPQKCSKCCGRYATDLFSVQQGCDGSRTTLLEAELSLF